MLYIMTTSEISLKTLISNRYTQRIIRNLLCNSYSISIREDGNKVGFRNMDMSICHKHIEEFDKSNYHSIMKRIKNAKLLPIHDVTFYSNEKRNVKLFFLKNNEFCFNVINKFQDKYALRFNKEETFALLKYLTLYKEKIIRHLHEPHINLFDHLIEQYLYWKVQFDDNERKLIVNLENEIYMPVLLHHIEKTTSFLSKEKQTNIIQKNNVVVKKRYVSDRVNRFWPFVLWPRDEYNTNQSLEENRKKYHISVKEAEILRLLLKRIFAFHYFKKSGGEAFYNFMNEKKKTMQYLPVKYIQPQINAEIKKRSPISLTKIEVPNETYSIIADPKKGHSGIRCFGEEIKQISLYNDEIKLNT